MRAILLLLLAWPLAPEAQTPADTVRLAALRAAAEAQDARAVQPALLERAAALRIEALRTTMRPQLALTGQGTIQSDVPTIPLSLPDGSSPMPPKEQVRVQMEADWSLYDGGRTSGRIAVEQARLAESQAGVSVALYGLREATTEAYFGALLLQSRAETIRLAAQDLRARLATLRTQAQEGTALSAHADALEADLIGLRQQADDAEAQRRAALAVLRDLTDLSIDTTTVFVLPDLASGAGLHAAERARGQRPEMVRFAATAERAEAEAALANRSTQPTIGLFGQAGVGRPSPLTFLSDEVEPFAVAGVRVRWAPFDWGRARREAEAARVQAEIARTEADAFMHALERQTEDEMAQIERLDRALTQDDRIVALRESALRVAAAQLDEGVLLPDAYTDRVTDLAEARLTRQRHRIERVRAQASMLSTLGLFPDSPQDR